MLAKYDRAGIKLFISDFSLDMGIPSVGVLAYDPTTFPEKSEIVWTAGTTPDPQKALSRALTEVAQLAGDFDSGSNYVASGLPKFRKLEEAEFIIHPQTQIDISGLPEISSDNIRVEVENCIAALGTRGFDVLAIDTKHPLLEVPAFYTIIPGTHFRERALGTSVGMFTAKLITENSPAQEALSGLENMEKLLPQKYYLKFYQGMCHLSLDNPQAALEQLRQSLDLTPHHQDLPSIYSYMGICLKDMGRYREALQVLEKGERCDNERTDIYNLMGFCHFMLKEHEAAIACFEKVLRLDPGSAIDYANIASNYRDMGRTEEAIRYYEMALAIDPNIEFASDNLAKLKKGR